MWELSAILVLFSHLLCDYEANGYMLLVRRVKAHYSTCIVHTRPSKRKQGINKKPYVIQIENGLIHITKVAKAGEIRVVTVAQNTETSPLHCTPANVCPGTAVTGISQLDSCWSPWSSDDSVSLGAAVYFLPPEKSTRSFSTGRPRRFVSGLEHVGQPREQSVLHAELPEHCAPLRFWQPTLSSLIWLLA